MGALSKQAHDRPSVAPSSNSQASSVPPMLCRSSGQLKAWEAAVCDKEALRLLQEWRTGKVRLQGASAARLKMRAIQALAAAGWRRRQRRHWGLPLQQAMLLPALQLPSVLPLLLSQAALPGSKLGRGLVVALLLGLHRQ